MGGSQEGNGKEERNLIAQTFALLLVFLLFLLSLPIILGSVEGKMEYFIRRGNKMSKKFHRTPSEEQANTAPN